MMFDTDRHTPGDSPPGRTSDSYLGILTIYCPACGTASPAQIESLAPGTSEWACPECSTLFSIEIGFFTIKEPTDERG